MDQNSLMQRMRFCINELEESAHIRELCSVRGVNLCSNDYLGLATNRCLRLALIDAVEKCDKIASTGSRLLSGHHSVWDELEEEFATFAGTEASLFFTSGFAANIGLLSAILEPGDVVFSDALNHASIIDGIRLSRAQKMIYQHRDLDSLERALRDSWRTKGTRVVVTESIFSMDGDRAPLTEIFQLAEKYGADVIVDEAHATGVMGSGGRGLLVEQDIYKQALAIVHTCGKALASMGAFVCGSKILKQFLVNHARSFVFNTALPPYVALQIQTALRLAKSMEAERVHLSSLSADLRARLKVLGYDCASDSQIVPLIVGSNEEVLHLASVLEESGFAVKAIRPPSVPPGTERLRISLTAALSGREIEHFANIVGSLYALGVTHG